MQFHKQRRRNNTKSTLIKIVPARWCRLLCLVTRCCEVPSHTLAYHFFAAVACRISFFEFDFSLRRVTYHHQHPYILSILIALVVVLLLIIYITHLNSKALRIKCLHMNPPSCSFLTFVIFVLVFSCILTNFIKVVLFRIFHL